MSSAVPSIRSQFPIFRQHADLIYLDNAATSQMPDDVINAIHVFSTREHASVHRGLYNLSANATRKFESIRGKVANFIGSPSPSSISFTKGTTESINLVALGWAKKKLKSGDNIVISAMEHHANLIPWQQLCLETNADLRIIPVNKQGELDLLSFTAYLDSRTKLLAITHISNVLGTVNPIAEIISIAHGKGIPVLIDAAQSAGHLAIDVKESNVDFLAFSAHKMFGPTGIGVLYCRPEFTAGILPVYYGGGSVKNVSFETTEHLDYPHCLEAGTANAAGVIGLGTAIDFIRGSVNSTLNNVPQELCSYFKDRLNTMGGITLVGDPHHHDGIVSFNIDGIHPHDVASFLAESNIAVRAGHHCAQPLLESMGIPAAIRVSFAIYNTREDADKTLEALAAAKKYWS